MAPAAEKLKATDVSSVGGGLNRSPLDLGLVVTLGVIDVVALTRVVALPRDDLGLAGFIGLACGLGLFTLPWLLLPPPRWPVGRAAATTAAIGNLFFAVVVAAVGALIVTTMPTCCFLGGFWLVVWAGLTGLAAARVGVRLARRPPGG